MEKRSLGNSGIQASVVGLGTNNFGMKIDLDASRAVINAALDAGITFFDTADMYGNTQSEDFIGQTLGRVAKIWCWRRNSAASPGCKRARKSGRTVRTSSNVWKTVSSAYARITSISTNIISLIRRRRLKRPLAALDELVRQGKVRAVGCSNLSGAQIAEATTKSQERQTVNFVTAQNEWSLLKRDAEREVIPACDKYGLGQLPFFPLASGMLTGKYRRGEEFAAGTRLATISHFKGLASDENFTKIEAFQAFAEKRGHTILELAMSWLAAYPCVSSVIAGATTPEQVRANASAANWKLSAEELTEVNKLVPLASA